MYDDDFNLALGLSLSESEAKSPNGNGISEQEKAFFTSGSFNPRGTPSVRTGGFSQVGTLAKPRDQSPRSRPVQRVDDDYAFAKALQDEEVSRASQQSTHEPRSHNSKDAKSSSILSGLFSDPSKCAGCGWPFISGRVMLYEGDSFI
jgi:hypothetical protein